MRNVIAFIEQKAGTPRRVSFELATAAKDLAAPRSKALRLWARLCFDFCEGAPP